MVRAVAAALAALVVMLNADDAPAGEVRQQGEAVRSLVAEMRLLLRLEGTRRVTHLYARELRSGALQELEDAERSGQTHHSSLTPLIIEAISATRSRDFQRLIVLDHRLAARGY
jgi:hypothetical protein